MHDRVDLNDAQRVVQRDMIGKVDLVEGEVRMRDIGEPVALELDIIIVVEVVDADDALPPRQQGTRDVRADEPGNPGHDDGHLKSFIRCSTGPHYRAYA